MTNTDDERAARDWLLNLQRPGATLDKWQGYVATILRLLDRPIIPRGEDVPDDVIFAMHKAYDNVTLDLRSSWRAAIDVLHDWRTAPPLQKRNFALACDAALQEAEVGGGYDSERFIKALAARGYKLVEAADADAP